MSEEIQALLGSRLWCGRGASENGVGMFEVCVGWCG